MKDKLNLSFIMKQKMRSMRLSLISFNALGLFNFDTLRGILLSRNILKRLAKTAELMAEHNPDIIILQEVHTYSVLKLLRKKLAAYSYVAYKKFFYGPKGGLVIFSKLPVDDITYTNFHTLGTFSNKSFIALVIRNGVLSCKIRGIPLYILNVYLTPNTDHDYSRESKFNRFTEAQIDQLTELIDQYTNTRADCLIAGDFNTEKGSHAYNKFLTYAQVRDIFSNHSTPTQHQEYIPKKQTVKRIDFIFLTSKFIKLTIDNAKHLFTEKVLINKRREAYLSDHIALQANLTFRFDEL